MLHSPKSRASYGRQRHTTRPGGVSVPCAAADSNEVGGTFLTPECNGRSLFCVAETATLDQNAKNGTGVSSCHRETSV